MDNDIHQNASDLVRLARTAFQERRLRDCLALIDVILQMDPANKDAAVLQSWIRTDLDEDFQLARNLAEETRRQTSKAQVALRRVLSVDPNHEGAKHLLAETLSAPNVRPEAAAEVPQSLPAEPQDSVAVRPPQPVFIEAGVRMPPVEPGEWEWIRHPAAWMLGLRMAGRYMQERPIRMRIAAAGVISVFVLGVFSYALLNTKADQQDDTSPQALSDAAVSTEPPQAEDAPAAAGVSGEGRIDLVVVPRAGVELTVDNRKLGAPPEFLMLKPGTHQLVFTAAGRSPETRQVQLEAGEKELLAVLLRENSFDSPARAKAGTASTDPAPTTPDPVPDPRTDPNAGKDAAATTLLAKNTVDVTRITESAAAPLAVARDGAGLDGLLRQSLAGGTPQRPPAPPALPAAAANPVPAEPLRVSGGIIQGYQIYSPPPAYPAAARQAGVQGDVVFEALIGKTGLVENLKLISGSTMLASAARDTVKTWRYKPTILNNEPIEVLTTITVKFSITR